MAYSLIASFLSSASNATGTTISAWSGLPPNGVGTDLQPTSSMPSPKLLSGPMSVSRAQISQCDGRCPIHAINRDFVSVVGWFEFRSMDSCLTLSLEAPKRVLGTRLGPFILAQLPVFPKGCDFLFISLACHYRIPTLFNSLIPPSFSRSAASSTRRRPFELAVRWYSMPEPSRSIRNKTPFLLS